MVAYVLVTLITEKLLYCVNIFMYTGDFISFHVFIKFSTVLSVVQILSCVKTKVTVARYINACLRGYHTTLATRRSSMATHGAVKAFNVKVDDWPTYVERLQHYLIANDACYRRWKEAVYLTDSVWNPNLQVATQPSPGWQAGYYYVRRFGEGTQGVNR